MRERTSLCGKSLLRNVDTSVVNDEQVISQRCALIGRLFCPDGSKSQCLDNNTAVRLKAYGTISRVIKSYNDFIRGVIKRTDCLSA